MNISLRPILIISRYLRHVFQAYIENNHRSPTAPTNSLILRIIFEVKLPLQTNNTNPPPLNFGKSFEFWSSTGFDGLLLREELHANKHDYEVYVRWYWWCKTELLWLKLVPVPICPSQISQGLDRDRNRVSAVTRPASNPWAMTGRKTRIVLFKY